MVPPLRGKMWPVRKETLINIISECVEYFLKKEKWRVKLEKGIPMRKSW